MSDELLNGAPLRKVNLRNTNPNLYRSLMVCAVFDVLMGFNFLFANLTFEQFGIPQEGVGVGFLCVGVPQLVFLNLLRNLKAVRIMVIVGIVYMLCWGVGTTETAFTGQSSFQLFLLYGLAAATRIPLLLEPFFNPLTANGNVDPNG